MEHEIWKDIPGFKGLYLASSFGRIKSLLKNQERILKGIPDKDGYYHITLYKDKQGKQGFVHRFIALTFLENPDKLPQVNHKDENKINNSIENLEWCDASYNQSYSKSKTMLFKNPSGELVEITNLSKFCKENGIHKGCMTHVYNGLRSHHKGWTAA